MSDTVVSEPRIALIHATPVAIEPVVESFRQHWPEARLCNLLDDSLAPDLACTGSVDAPMIERFNRLARYSVDAGADGILFTCSAFGSAIEDVARRLDPCPVLKPNEAMFAAALEAGPRVGLVATFEPSVPSMRAEFEQLAEDRGMAVDLATACVPEALEALKAGDRTGHDRRIAEAAAFLGPVDVVMLAQFSMASAKAMAESASGRPVLTSPDSAVHLLRSLVPPAGR